MFSNTKNSIDQVPTAAMRPVKKDSRFPSVIKLKTRGGRGIFIRHL